MKPDPVIDRLRAEMATARTRHSPLRKWMKARYNALWPILSDPNDVNWQVAADVIKAAGVKDGHGKTPSPERVKRTWTRLMIDMGPPQKPEKPVRAPANPEKPDGGSVFITDPETVPPVPHPAPEKPLPSLGGKDALSVFQQQMMAASGRV